MSLFVAIVPPLDAVEDLADALHRVRRDPRAAKVHWHPAERWHVTMCFLGDPDDDADEVIGESMDEVAATLPAPRLQLSSSGAFGRQVLWVGVTGVDDQQTAAFADLASAIARAARSGGFTVERRPWRPHLTIGRTRGDDARPVAPLLEGYRGPAWAPTDLLTVRSQGGPSPVHTVVHRSQLALR